MLGQIVKNDLRFVPNTGNMACFCEKGTVFLSFPIYKGFLWFHYISCIRWVSFLRLYLLVLQYSLF
jgi:hypothetical protein